MGIASRTNSSDDDDLANVNDIRATRDGDQKEDGDHGGFASKYSFHN
jgi:hypothetical protein